MPTFSISGSVGAAGAGATITLSGAASATTTAAAGTGNYSFSSLANGSYLVTPGLTGLAFSPPNDAVVINSADVTGVTFLTFTPKHSTGIFDSGSDFSTRVESPTTSLDRTDINTKVTD